MQALVGAHGDGRSTALALALAEVGNVPAGSEKDKAAVKCSAEFAREVVAVGGVLHLGRLQVRILNPRGLGALGSGFCTWASCSCTRPHARIHTTPRGLQACAAHNKWA